MKLNFNNFRNTLKTVLEYLFPVEKVTSYFKSIKSKEDLQKFIQQRSAHVTQTTLYGYLKTRMGHKFTLMVDDEEFSKSINLAKWNIYMVALADCSFYVFSILISEKNLKQNDCREVFLNIIAKFPYLIGGSADLAGSNNTKTKDHKIIKPGNFSGNYIHYGVREHAMCGIMNGIALHSSLIPYGGTFLIFSDYCKPAIRLAAMMKQRVIYVFTHDSIGLGEDGPTHQPIEQLTSLRSIPKVNVFRP